MEEIIRPTVTTQYERILPYQYGMPSNPGPLMTQPQPIPQLSQMTQFTQTPGQSIPKVSQMPSMLSDNIYCDPRMNQFSFMNQFRQQAPLQLQNMVNSYGVLPGSSSNYMIPPYMQNGMYPFNQNPEFGSSIQRPIPEIPSSYQFPGFPRGMMGINNCDIDVIPKRPEAPSFPINMPQPISNDQYHYGQSKEEMPIISRHAETQGITIVRPIPQHVREIPEPNKTPIKDPHANNNPSGLDNLIKIAIGETPHNSNLVDEKHEKHENNEKHVVKLSVPSKKADENLPGKRKKPEKETKQNAPNTRSQINTRRRSKLDHK